MHACMYCYAVPLIIAIGDFCVIKGILPFNFWYPVILFIHFCSFDDIVCLAKSHSLQEISLDGNPIASDQFYKQTILSNMQQLKQLDMKRVTVCVVGVICIVILNNGFQPLSLDLCIDQRNL